MYIVIIGNEKHDDTYDFIFDNFSNVMNFVKIVLDKHSFSACNCCIRNKYSISLFSPFFSIIKHLLSFAVDDLTNSNPILIKS